MESDWQAGCVSALIPAMFAANIRGLTSPARLNCKSVATQNGGASNSFGAAAGGWSTGRTAGRGAM
jgi:hypothetical protein